MSEPSWWTYIRRIAGTEIGRVIAIAAGVSEPQVSRWKSGKNTPDAATLIQFARHYNRPPVEALVAAGYLAPEEAGGTIEITQGLADLTDEELLTEVRARMEARHELETNEEPGTPGKASKDEKNLAPADESQAAFGRLADRVRGESLKECGEGQ